MAIGLTEPLLEKLRAGRHHLVVATQRPCGRTAHAELLADEEFVLIAAPACAERLKGQDLRTALESFPLITYAEDLPIVRRYWPHVFDRRLHAQAAITVPDLRRVFTAVTAVTAVTAGAGWSVLPSYLCQLLQAASERDGGGRQQAGHGRWCLLV
ncbi:LysR substrate-binding domain-containing protein [Streptomyces sp. NPDC002730]|uniref:LysR substrate-binding domain-containing protein n=1 Tax=Streptomyces sp. NPDC002730 TaxID=3364662 RepID=UPI0036B1C8CD